MTPERRLRLTPIHRRVSAGILDASFASLASFCVGLAAVRVLDAATLGAYALVFSALNLAAVLPRDLLFTPLEVAAVGHPGERRLATLKQGILLGGMVSLVAALLVFLCVLVMPAGAPRGAALALTATGAACTFLSPIQDHLRRMQHVADRSWAAATISGVQFATAIAALTLFLWIGVPPWWIPFGALAIANLLSGVLGVLLSSAGPRGGKPVAVRDLGGTVRSGKWLLVTGLAVPGGGFLARLLVAQLAGPEALGYAEAARIVGQPVFVLSVGLAATMTPRSIEAARQRRLDRAQEIARGFLLLIASAATGYLLLFGLPWPWNPLVRLVPQAFEIDGLVAATVLAIALNGASSPLRSELLGAQREKNLAEVELLGTSLYVCIGATAAVTQSFAMPLGLFLAGVARWIACWRTRRAVFGERDETGPALPLDSSAPQRVTIR